MSDFDKLRARIVELEVAAREGLKTIKWFESWLNGRDEPLRYNPNGLQKNPPEFSVNYNARDVNMIKDFIEKVLDNGKVDDNDDVHHTS